MKAKYKIILFSLGLFLFMSLLMTFSYAYIGGKININSFNGVASVKIPSGALYNWTVNTSNNNLTFSANRFLYNKIDIAVDNRQFVYNIQLKNNRDKTLWCYYDLYFEALSTFKISRELNTTLQDVSPEITIEAYSQHSDTPRLNETEIVGMTKGDAKLLLDHIAISAPPNSNSDIYKWIIYVKLYSRNFDQAAFTDQNVSGKFTFKEDYCEAGT